MNISFKEQLNSLLNCDLKSMYPIARSMKRKLHFFVGPTNSGKTYTAMQKLIQSDCGTYLAPLRLLALENHEFLKENNIVSSLITGEEELITEDSTHICSTIEMINFSLETDTCVIDEVQMLEDTDRGWAWVNAIIGAPSSNVYMTGSVNAIDSIKKIATYLGEELEIVRFKRMNPLKVLDNAIPFKEITKGTALIAFSRNDVLQIKSKLSRFFKVSVLYGNLSPEVRREEAKRFRNGDTDILVATDAIAMGLNLPIKTLLFTTDTKFDGISKRKLYPNEIVQIAGRAGRYGHHEVGYIGATKSSHLSHIRQMMDTPIKTIKPPFNVKASLEQIETLSTHLSTKSLNKILNFYHKNMKFSGPFIAANISNMIDLSLIIDKKNSLKLEDKYILSQAPINTRSPLIKDAYFSYINAVIKNKAISYNVSIDIKVLAKTQMDLLKAEDEVKKISLYLWLSYKMPNIFIDVDKAYKLRILVNKYCEDSLKLNLYSRPKSDNFVKRKRFDKKDNHTNNRHNHSRGSSRRNKEYTPKAEKKEEFSCTSKKHKIKKHWD